MCRRCLGPQSQYPDSVFTFSFFHQAFMGPLPTRAQFRTGTKPMKTEGSVLRLPPLTEFIRGIVYFLDQSVPHPLFIAGYSISELVPHLPLQVPKQTTITNVTTHLHVPVLQGAPLPLIENHNRKLGFNRSCVGGSPSVLTWVGCVLVFTPGLCKNVFFGKNWGDSSVLALEA